VGKRSPSPPPAPDPFAVASAEASFNRINQQTPFGSLNFFNPGQEQGAGAQVGQIPGALTPGAQALLPPPAPVLADPNQAPPGFPTSPQGFGGLSGFNPFTGGFSGQQGFTGFGGGGGNATSSAVLNLPPGLQFLENLRLSSDTNLLADALGRQRTLNPNQIDLGQFGPIQSQLDLSGIPQFQARGQIQGGGNVPNLNLQRGLDTQGLSQLPQNADIFRDDVTNAAFQRAQGLLNPQFQDQERALRQRLANQGLPQSSEAFDRELTRFERNRGEALNNAALDAVLFGGQEASRALGDRLNLRGQGFGERQALGEFGNNAALQQFAGQFDTRNARIEDQVRDLDLFNTAGLQNFQLGQQNLANQLAAKNFANTARTQGLNEQGQIRGNQFNELAALLGLQQVQAPQLQNFFGPGQVDVTGAFGLQQQGQLANFQAQQAQRAAGLGGLAGLGSAALLGPLSNKGR